MTLVVCGVMLTRAYIRCSFPEVDARLRATSRDETVVRRGKEETCMLGQEKYFEQEGERCCDQAASDTRGAILRAEPHDGLSGVLEAGSATVR